MNDFMRFIAEPFYLSSAFAFIILMMMLFLMPVPKGMSWRPFRHSLRYVKIAFGVMTALNIIQCIDPESPPHEYGILVLIIAFYQALLFTMCFLRLLNPRSTLRKFLVHLVWVSVGAVTVLAVHFLAPHLFCTIAYWIYLGSYICLGLYYTYLCRTGWRDSVKRLADYYDDDVFDRMRWLRRLMWTVFGVGVLALITSIWVEFNPVFVIVYTLAYAYFLVCLVRYGFNANFIVRPATEKKEEQQPASPQIEKMTVAAVTTEREVQLAAALKKWVEEKQYTKSDEAIEDVAHQLGTTYSFLTSYFQRYETLTFREWRTNLRVEEAKRLLREEPLLSVSDVLDMSGFNDRANFHRHFTRIVGCSPSAYRVQSRADKSL